MLNQPQHRSAEPYHGRPIEHSDHPHVGRVQGIGSGEPIILGTGIMVRTLIEQYQLGSTIDELLWDYPNLNPAQVYDALAYYHDHQPEMDRLLDEATYKYWQPIIARINYE